MDWYELSFGLSRPSDDAASRLASNSAWKLNYDLTVKVFSFLDVRSLCRAAFSCCLFRMAAMDSACYRDIDLTYNGVSDALVARCIQHSGQHLRSLKLGVGSGTSLLTKKCLIPLISNNSGALLQTLQIQNVDELDTRHVCQAVSICHGLLDLEIVGLCVNVKQVLHTVSSGCHDLRRLSIRLPIKRTSTTPSYCLRTSSCREVVQGCPKLSSLILQGFKLSDANVSLMLNGLQHLVELDLSRADMLTGLFLKDMMEEAQLKRLILRDCFCLKEREVESLLSDLIAGQCKGLLYLDVSNGVGLLSSVQWSGSFNVVELAPCHPRSNISEDKLLTIRKKRPQLAVHADFGYEYWSNICESMSPSCNFMKSMWMALKASENAGSNINQSIDFDDEFDHINSASDYQSLKRGRGGY